MTGCVFAHASANESRFFALAEMKTVINVIKTVTHFNLSPHTLSLQMSVAQSVKTM